MNQTLEEMARALFKSWFVDFDPVRAKAALSSTPYGGHDPPRRGTNRSENGAARRWASGRSNAPAPTSPAWTRRSPTSSPTGWWTRRLGEIPEGWEVKTLGEDFRITMGQSPPGTNVQSDRRRTTALPRAHRLWIPLPGLSRRYCNAPTRLGKAGDTLVSVRKATRRRCKHGPGEVLHWAWRRRSSTLGTGGKSYTYQLNASARLEVRTSPRLTVQCFGAINKTAFHSLPWVSADSTSCIATFDALCSPFDSRIETNELGDLLPRRATRCAVAQADYREDIDPESRDSETHCCQTLQKYNRYDGHNPIKFTIDKRLA